MIRKLGLERTLQGGTGVDKRVRNLIKAMIIQWIIAQGSKLAFHRALAPATATSSLALSVGLIDVAEREVYAALDWLIEQQTRIEAALAKKHLIDGTLVLYDVSSRCCALAKPGYSRDHRPDRSLITIKKCSNDGENANKVRPKSPERALPRARLFAPLGAAFEQVGGKERKNVTLKLLRQPKNRSIMHKVQIHASQRDQSNTNPQ